MTLSQFTNEDLELLFHGEPAHPELGPLTPFIATLREQGVSEPHPADVELAAVRAAAVARSHAVSSRPPPHLTFRRPSAWRRLMNHSTVVLGSVLALFALSGIGLAANAASPGDLLYGIDLAMEEIGIGTGSIEERLAEARVLVDRNDLSGAVALLSESIAQADPDGSPADLAAAEQALQELSSDLGVEADANGASAEAEEQVSDLLDFIEANAGKGNGFDGKEFGQGVAEIAKGDEPDTDEPEDPGSDSDEAPGNSENSNAGGNGNGGSAEPPGNSGNSNSGGNGSGSSAEPPGNSGNSNSGGNGNGNVKP